jgi:hypothetical protein
MKPVAPLMMTVLDMVPRFNSFQHSAVSYQHKNMDESWIL